MSIPGRYTTLETWSMESGVNDRDGSLGYSLPGVLLDVGLVPNGSGAIPACLAYLASLARS